MKDSEEEQSLHLITLNFWFTIEIISSLQWKKPLGLCQQRRWVRGSGQAFRDPTHPEVKCFPKLLNVNAMIISKKSLRRNAKPEEWPAAPDSILAFDSSHHTIPYSHNFFPPDKGILDPQAFCCFENCFNLQIRDYFSLYPLLFYCTRKAFASCLNLFS